MRLPQQHVSLQAYPDGKNVQPDRQKFYRGEAFSVTGDGRSHGRVTANLVRHLDNQLTETPCQVFFNP